jgi:hypothetical protein
MMDTGFREDPESATPYLSTSALAVTKTVLFLTLSRRGAETPEQIKAAKAALKRWQANRPNDPTTNALLVQLPLRETWLRIKREWD